MRKKFKLEDENSKLEDLKYNLENRLDEREKTFKKKEEQMKHFDKELQEQKSHHEKEVKEMEKNTKSLRNELKETDSALKSKTIKIKELETLISRKDSQLKEEKVSKESIKKKLLDLEEAEIINSEYKIDLESRIKELEDGEASLQKQIKSLKSHGEESKGLKMNYEIRMLAQ